MVAPVQRQEHDGPYEPSCTHHDLTSQPDVLGWGVGAGEEQGCVGLLFPGLSPSFCPESACGLGRLSSLVLRPRGPRKWIPV